MRILLLEDDPDISTFIIEGLQRQGHILDHVTDGNDVLSLVMVDRDLYELIILDRMVPGLDGLSVLKTLRAAKLSIPVLLLTSMSDIDDRVEGLEAGADDYLVKPFALSELSARINALSRRSSELQSGTDMVLQSGGLRLDCRARKCSFEGRDIPLSSLEFNLLENFMRNAGRVLTKNMLLERVWDMNFDPMTSVVETHISRLRNKIEKPFDAKYITTLRGSGYRFDG